MIQKANYSANFSIKDLCLMPKQHRSRSHRFLPILLWVANSLSSLKSLVNRQQWFRYYSTSTSVPDHSILSTTMTVKVSPKWFISRNIKTHRTAATACSLLASRIRQWHDTDFNRWPVHDRNVLGLSSIGISPEFPVSHFAKLWKQVSFAGTSLLLRVSVSCCSKKASVSDHELS